MKPETKDWVIFCVRPINFVFIALLWGLFDQPLTTMYYWCWISWIAAATVSLNGLISVDNDTSIWKIVGRTIIFVVVAPIWMLFWFGFLLLGGFL